MSYDMAFWQEPQEIDAAGAYQKYDAMTDGKSGVSAESTRVRDFYAAVLKNYPDLTVENSDTSPWTSAVYCNGECVIVTISWSRKNELVDTLISLAQRHGLLAYDPQKEEVHR
ncbi:hypothetical protein ACIRRX_12335 [Streptomyces bacillaris]|uniref:hypothetical protein n=1 Tax=Streptomyces cavourensis TaxID=67258 RepID=UPI0013C32C8F|nr:hypothetical protein [Streptomyces cavourensis]